MSTPDLLTASRMRAARGCMRLHSLTYEQGYRPAETAEALRFGTLIHRGLEAWLRSGLSLDATLDAMAGEADPYQRAAAEELMRGYHFRWQDQDLEVLAVEASFQGPLVNPETGRSSPAWRLAGKVDAIVRERRASRTLVMEHKTASGDIGPGSDYWRRLRMDGQVSTYYDGARLLGHEPEGCLYDVLGKPGLKPYKATPVEERQYTQPKSRACKECGRKRDPKPAPHAETLDDGAVVHCVGGRIVTDPGGRLYANQREADETPDEYRLRVREAIVADPAAYYQRGEVVRLESEMDEARADTWQLAGQIREARRLGIAPRNPDYCSKWGRTCAFFDVCTGAASLDDPSRFTRLADVHPELVEVE